MTHTVSALGEIMVGSHTSRTLRGAALTLPEVAAKNAKVVVRKEVVNFMVVGKRKR